MLPLKQVQRNQMVTTGFFRLANIHPEKNLSDLCGNNTHPIKYLRQKYVSYSYLWS